MLDTAEKEIAWSNELWNDTEFKELREQMETDFGLTGPAEFHMPGQEKGKWYEVTSKRPGIIRDKVVSYLATSDMQLFIPADEELRKKRTNISKTEQLANSGVWMADSDAVQSPDGRKLQQALAAWFVLRGGAAETVLWYKDEKTGKPKLSWQVYDPFCCQWISGGNRLTKFCYRDWVSPDYIKSVYGDELKKNDISEGEAKSSTDKRRLLLYLYDDGAWKIAHNGKYLKEEEHGLGYVPAYVRSCGSLPRVHSEKYGTDSKSGTMKYSWQSFATNCRNMFDLESMLLSIGASIAIESGKIKLLVTVDSSKDGGGTAPAGIEKLGFGDDMSRNQIVTLDTGKGQGLVAPMQAADGRVIEAFLPQVVDREREATMDPITSGVMSKAGSGALANELKASAMDFINAFRQGVEEAFVWGAKQVVSQFKGGHVVSDKIDIEGYSKQSKFYAEISPADVDDKYHFECKLVPDKLRDKSVNLGMAEQGVKAGLYSPRTAMQDFNLHPDPDREMDLIKQANAEKILMSDPVYLYDQMAKACKDAGDERMALYYQEMAQQAIDMKVQENMQRKAQMAAAMMGTPEPGANGQPGVMPPPGAEVERMQEEATMMTPEAEEV